MYYKSTWNYWFKSEYYILGMYGPESPERNVWKQEINFLADIKENS